MLLLYHKVLGFIYVQRELEKNKNESLKDNHITQWLVSTSLPFSIDKNLHVLRKGTRLIF